MYICVLCIYVCMRLYVYNGLIFHIFISHAYSYINNYYYDYN